MRASSLPDDYSQRTYRSGVLYTTASASRAYRLERGESIKVRLENGRVRTGIVGLKGVLCPYVLFKDGTELSLLRCDIEYDPERDPTRDEMAEDDYFEKVERDLKEGDARCAQKKRDALEKLTLEERELLGVK